MCALVVPALHFDSFFGHYYCIVLFVVLAVFRFVASLLCLIFNVIYLPHIVTDWARTRGATKPAG